MTARDDVRKLHATRFVEHFVGQDERSPLTAEVIIHLHESLRVSLSVLRSLRYNVESQSQNRLSRSGPHGGPSPLPHPLMSERPFERCVVSEQALTTRTARHSTRGYARKKSASDGSCESRGLKFSFAKRGSLKSPS